MSKIFITGGAGFIGSFLAKELLENGDEVIIYDAFLNYVDPNKSHYHHYLNLRLNVLNGKVEIVRGDIRNKGLLLRTLNKYRPDKVVHLAALPIATASDQFSEDAMTINLNGTVNVLEAISECPFVKRFIYTSSSMIYGDFQREPCDEEHPKNPIGVYGGTKLAGETLTKVYAKRFGFEYTIIRPSAVYGPTDANRRVSQIFVDMALQGKPLTLHEGGRSKLDFSYVEDVAHGFVLALNSDKAVNETFNITRGEGRSIKEFAEIVKQHIPGVRTVEEPLDIERPERGALDISKARRLLGYNPKYPIEQGIPKYIEFVKNSGVFNRFKPL